MLGRAAPAQPRQPVLIAQQRRRARAGGGGRGPGGGWVGEPGTAGGPGTQRLLCPGCPGKEVPGDGSASRPPPLPRRGEPSSASPPMQPRRPSAGVWGAGRRRRGRWWHRGMRLPPRPPQGEWGARGSPAPSPFPPRPHPLPVPQGCCAPSPAPQTAAGSSRPRSPRLRQNRDPQEPGAAPGGQAGRRQGLKHPPQLHVAKGNLKCQSHQPQYVRAPAKRSSAEAALVQPVPAPLPPSRRCRLHPPSKPWATSCLWAQPCGEGPGPGARARWEQAGGITLHRAQGSSFTGA